ncbi:MAG: hypothetical protein HC769_35815 [Cyanobacteria bacterium CRU_2_1]|nr:hypothetical protein [Cyanobacteria bacterium CRU_2_1]
MPKYSVSEVLDIIKTLTKEEQLELQARLSEVLTLESFDTSHLSQRQSQTFGNVSIGGSGIAADFGQKQAVGGNITAPQNVVQAEGDGLQEVWSLLANLKQGIANSNSLDALQKAMAEAQIKVVEVELKKPEPDKGLVSRTISTLKQGLEGVLTLAEPVVKVANLIAKAWGIPVP